MVGWLDGWMDGIDVLKSFVTLAGTHAILLFSVTLLLLPRLFYSPQFNLIFSPLHTTNNELESEVWSI